MLSGIRDDIQGAMAGVTIQQQQHLPIFCVVRIHYFNVQSHAYNISNTIICMLGRPSDIERVDRMRSPVIDRHLRYASRLFVVGMSWYGIL